MNTEDLKHRINSLIDEWASHQGDALTEANKLDEPKRVLPEGKRTVRTKSSGDRVYFIDEEKKTRQWVTSPEVLTSLGFEIGDVQEIEDAKLLEYTMAPAIFKKVNG